MSAHSAATRDRARLLRTISWVLIAAVLALGRIEAATASPDAADVEGLAASLAGARAVRVSGPFGTRVLRDVRLDASGVVDARWGPGGRVRPALIASSDIMPPVRPGPIAWSEIARIETGRTSTARLGAIGLGLGGLLGAVVWHTVPLGYDGGRGPVAVVVGVPALTGLVLGGVLGSQQYRWHTVHPRAAAEP